VTRTVGAFVLTAGMVAAAAEARLVAGPADRVFDAVTTDSRSLPAGALFIALRGPRFDGQAFVDNVIARGAAGVLVSEPPAAAGEAAVIVAPDTLAALQRLGREVRRRSAAHLVAITGSAGKTTTKEVAADFLSVRYRVVRNPGNLNNHIGLPLSLLELRHGPDVAVVELGMNHAGEIRTLVQIAEPDVRVWTNVGDAHLGHFSSREAIADAKAEILEHATAETLLVANADDPLIMARVGGFGGRRLTFGERPGADVRASDVRDLGFDGTTAIVSTPAGRLDLSVKLPGRAQLSNVLAAIAVAIDLGVPPTSVEAHARDLRPFHRRGSTSPLRGGARLVDDSYNASPAAMQAMLEALKATPVAGRRVAVLGEMLELGDSSPALHEACGRAAAAAGVQELVVIGGAAAESLAMGAERAGLDRTHVHRFSDSLSAADAIPLLIRPGDLVLVKGSRGTRTDVVADRLKEVA
jgi:UDP-N-acetylmuramoyl-tripeptide--D-alanyl-D-alanine ligase